MNDFLEKYRELKQNRKKFGLYRLGFWLIFLVIVVFLYYIPTGYVSNKSYNSNKKEEVKEDTINNYSFKYIIDEKEYSGSYVDNTIELIGDDCSFYIIDNNIFMDKEICILPDYKYVDINNLNELIEHAKLNSTTSYTDGKEEYKYIKEENDIKTEITYTKNKDNTIDIDIYVDEKETKINYFDINNINISFDSGKYKYEYKEVENEY